MAANVNSVNQMLMQLRQEDSWNLATVTFTGEVNMSDDLIVTGNRRQWRHYNS